MSHVKRVIEEREHAQHDAAERDGRQWPYMAGQPRAQAEVRHLAASVGIYSAIVVGMLQRHGVVPRTHMVDLKDSFVFASKG